MHWSPVPRLAPARHLQNHGARQHDLHHQGIDWQYGGWDRDVLQADVADNGPNDGDRLLD